MTDQEKLSRDILCLAESSPPIYRRIEMIFHLQISADELKDIKKWFALRVAIWQRSITRTPAE
jgi:hypothetical protein